MASPALVAQLDSVPAWMLDAARDGGAVVVPVEQADTVVWGGAADASGLSSLLAEHGEHLRWVQLPWAGVEPYLSLMDRDRIWTCAKGAYGDDVAEMALAMMLAGLRGLVSSARSTSWRQHGELGTNLHGAEVCIVGGGGIAEHLLRLLEPFACTITVVRRRPRSMPGVDHVVGVQQLDDVLPRAQVVVLALALSPDSVGLIDARRLRAMRADAWLVNVARGAHVVTADLVEALERGEIAGAALDVTDPEPLPVGHALWHAPNCLITPHVANTSQMLRPRLVERISENCRRWSRGDELLGVVDPDLGY